MESCVRKYFAKPLVLYHISLHAQLNRVNYSWISASYCVGFLQQMSPRLSPAPSLTPSNPGARAEWVRGPTEPRRVRSEGGTYLRSEAETGQLRGDKLLISRARPDYFIPYYLWSKDANRIEIEYKQTVKIKSKEAKNVRFYGLWMDLCCIWSLEKETT